MASDKKIIALTIEKLCHYAEMVFWATSSDDERFMEMNDRLIEMRDLAKKDQDKEAEEAVDLVRACVALCRRGDFALFRDRLWDLWRSFGVDRRIC